MSEPPEVRLVRVFDKPQNWMAYALSDGKPIGYCGRDGVITHPEPGIAIGFITKVSTVEDSRAPRQGLRRSMKLVRKMLSPGADEVLPSSTKKETTWKEIGRQERGLYASGKVHGPGWRNDGYICIISEVSETRTVGTRKEPETEYRTRLEIGPACRMRGEGYEAFVSLYKQYAGYARQHGEGAHVENHMQCFHKEELPRVKISRTRLKQLDAMPAVKAHKEVRKVIKKGKRK